MCVSTSQNLKLETTGKKEKNPFNPRYKKKVELEIVIDQEEGGSRGGGERETQFSWEKKLVGTLGCL